MEFERTNALVCIFILNLFSFCFVLQTLLWLLTALKLQFLEGGFGGAGGGVVMVFKDMNCKERKTLFWGFHA